MTSYNGEHRFDVNRLDHRRDVLVETSQSTTSVIPSRPPGRRRRSLLDEVDADSPVHLGDLSQSAGDGAENDDDGQVERGELLADGRSRRTRVSAERHFDPVDVRGDVGELRRTGRAEDVPASGHSADRSSSGSRVRHAAGRRRHRHFIVVVVGR